MELMGMITGVPNWLSLLVAVGALVYITKDTSTMKNLRGKVGI